MNKFIAGLALSLVVAGGQAQTYPTRKVTTVVGRSAGGAADAVMHLLAEGMRTQFPNRLVVVNKTVNHDAVKATMELPSFKEAMKTRGREIDYKDPVKLKQSIWVDYKKYTVVLKQIGALK